MEMKEPKAPKALAQGAMDLLKILEDKLPIKTQAEEQQGAYSMSALKTALKPKYDNDKIDQFMYELQNSKLVELKCVSIKEFEHNRNYPYWYVGEFDAEAYKEKLEKISQAKFAEYTTNKQHIINTHRAKLAVKEEVKKSKK